MNYAAVRSFSLKLVRERGVKYPVDKVGEAFSAARAIRAFVGDRDCEHVCVCMLGPQHEPIGMHLVAIGQLAGVELSLRSVFKAAIVANASAIVLGHNHPSGNATPSAEDLAFTKAAVVAGKMLGIPILDHVIVTTNDHHSMLDHGQMGSP